MVCHDKSVLYLISGGKDFTETITERSTKFCKTFYSKNIKVSRLEFLFSNQADMWQYIKHKFY